MLGIDVDDAAGQVGRIGYADKSTGLLEPQHSVVGPTRWPVRLCDSRRPGASVCMQAAEQ